MPANDTELADRLLEQRLKARLFGASPEPPTIGPYRLDGRLGAGGMGVVYRAHDLDLGRDIALKVMHPDLTGAAARLRDEARALARIAHPNVVTVFDTGEHEGRLYVAMEFVEGTTLRVAVERVRAAQPRARALRVILEQFLQAARGLQDVHASGLVHCDFKPENVLVGVDGRVRVVDFGIASLSGVPAGELEAAGELDATTCTRGGEVVGTPAYMAPEQFLGGRIDARADQFAFCVALQEAVTGARPFAGATLTALMTSVLSGAPTPPPRWVPARLRAVLARGLARDPDRRFLGMAELIRELERLVAPRTWRTVALAASAACVAMLVAVALREPPPPPVEAASGLDLGAWLARQVPLHCLPAPPTGGADESHQSEQLAAAVAAALPDSPESFDARGRWLAHQLRRGNFDACKTVAMTLRTAPPELPWHNAADLRCMWSRHCTASADTVCLPGLTATGVGGCAPTATCAVRGLPAEAVACHAGQVECCHGAFVLSRFSAQKLGTLDDPTLLDAQRGLAEAGCDGGHAALCAELASSSSDPAATAARRRACEWGHRRSCAPSAP